MKKETSIDLSEQLKPFKGKWVTLSEDKQEILGVGDDVRTAVNQAHEKGVTNPLLIKVPTSEVRSYFF